MACRHCAVEHPAGISCPSSFSRAASLEGQRHGPLLLRSVVGSGALGTVYLAEHAPTGHRFAVKVLHPHLASRPRVRARFLAEARALRGLTHRNVARVLDARRGPGGLPCLLMEYAEGERFSRLPVPLAPAEVVELLDQSLAALEAAHARGLVHGDVSADNLVLGWDARGWRQVKLLDFGASAVLSASLSEAERACGMVVGSPAFIAPEQWAGQVVDGRADLYALGVVGYLLATGRLPFGFGRVGEVAAVSPHQLNPRMPEALSQVLLRALAQRPAERFASAKDFRAALSAFGARASARTRTSRGTLSVFGDVVPEDGATPLHVALLDAAHGYVEAEAPVSGPRVAAPSGLGVRLGLGTDAELVPVATGDVTVEGFFAHWAGPLPPLAAQVPVELTFEGRVVACDADVVRHVTGEEARAWDGAAGLCVQFASESARGLLGQALGRRGVPRGMLDDEPVPDTELARLLSRAAVVVRDPYALLGAAPDEDFEGVRRRVGAVLRRLGALGQRALPTGQRRALEALRRQVERAGRTLGEPLSRVGFDAVRGNLAGVSRCVQAGLADERVEPLRKAYLEARPLAERRARALFTQGHALEVGQSLEEALTRYAEALSLDPLNTPWLRHYENLRARARAAEPVEEGATASF
ncbi:serine/threonine protein kinase [Myxococcus sp. K15C18031901]|uniref:serine/threonine-protein kinase n=1 Tax=Myxococcus dinghuensis TaxID=2906761 RepID=UPI0020A7FBA9|nr:serine/threonine-protein kinase [Myxococcus dinghuensis]MCP3102225.1 serine/threonine protein kinase [Myxococcus dinghuensis]